MPQPTLVKSPKSFRQNDEAYSVQLKPVAEPRWLPVLYYIYCMLAGPYLIWRFTIINWQVWYGPVAYLAEIYGFVMTLTYLWIARRIDHPVHRPTKLNRSVDALIPTLNEPIEVLEPVVLGALKVRGINRVLVLDDGNRAWVRAMCNKLGANYYARGSSEHAKAGNLNFGLQYSQAEFILSLDADHIPMPYFLERTLGYFDDPQLAFVQSPQTYYNTDSFLFRRRRGNSFWSEQCMFYDMIQPSKNRYNSAFFVGTSALLRRSAIDSIGGFATGTATEDIHTSLKLHARKWKSLFVPEPLAFGLEAASFKEFYKQRRRWAAGSLGLLFRSPDSPLRAKGLTWRQRLNYINATLAHLQGVQKLLFFITPILASFTLVGPIVIGYGWYNLIFTSFLLIAVGFTAIYARGTYHPIYTEAYSMANLLAHFGGIKGILKVQRKFAVSSKTAKPNEPTWLKNILWFLFAIGVIGLLRDIVLLNMGDPHRGLLISSLIFTDLNLIFLASFLAYLWGYERRSDDPPSTGAVQWYEHIKRSYGRPVPETLVAQDFKQKTPS
ncbi:MAG TPA: glycosyltransferase family 2 protein [Candidatus Nanoarchaeia archaeon]|nr:glycosyltransferase family 2 protein [Candidatus Nanoarchaeia archaeon]